MLLDLQDQQIELKKQMVLPFMQISTKKGTEKPKRENEKMKAKHGGRRNNK